MVDKVLISCTHLTFLNVHFYHQMMNKQRETSANELVLGFTYWENLRIWIEVRSAEAPLLENKQENEMRGPEYR